MSKLFLRVENHIVIGHPWLRFKLRSSRNLRKIYNFHLFRRILTLKTVVLGIRLGGIIPEKFRLEILDFKLFLYNYPNIREMLTDLA